MVKIKEIIIDYINSFSTWIHRIVGDEFIYLRLQDFRRLFRCVVSFLLLSTVITSCWTFVQILLFLRPYAHTRTYTHIFILLQVNIDKNTKTKRGITMRQIYRLLISCHVECLTINFQSRGNCIPLELLCIENKTRTYTTHTKWNGKQKKNS